MPSPDFFLALLASYLWGALPTAYLVARSRGVDLRRFGSGNVGSSNLRRVTGRWTATFVGLFDVFKGALPVYLAQRAGWDVTAAGLLGIAAICGHNWPLYLRFVGGRGLATTLGVLLMVAPWAWLFVVGGLAVGTALHRVALWAIIGFALVPLVSFLVGQSDALTRLLLALFALTLLKRLVANGAPPAARAWRRVYWNRFWYDRDVGPDEAWSERTEFGVRNS